MHACLLGGPFAEMIANCVMQISFNSANLLLDHTAYPLPTRTASPSPPPKKLCYDYACAVCRGVGLFAARHPAILCMYYINICWTYSAGKWVPILPRGPFWPRPHIHVCEMLFHEYCTVCVLCAVCVVPSLALFDYDESAHVTQQNANMAWHGHENGVTRFPAGHINVFACLCVCVWVCRTIGEIPAHGFGNEAKHHNKTYFTIIVCSIPDVYACSLGYWVLFALRLRACWAFDFIYFRHKFYLVPYTVAKGTAQYKHIHMHMPTHALF